MKQLLVKAPKAGKFVNTAHVTALRSNYKNERWLQNSKNLGKSDSLSVWYSIEELEQFLASAKEDGGDGVRMYFGAYDKDHAPNPLYAGRQTIVMVATKSRESNGIIVDKDLFVTNGTETSIVAYNVGRLCPPLCIEKPGGFEEIQINITDRAISS